VESNIIALGFESESAAEDMLSTFMHLQEQGLVTIDDAVVATRGPGKNVEIRQTRSETAKHALRGTGIGLLAGLLLGGPIGGLVGGAAIGAIAGALKDQGIDDKFINNVSTALRPNSSSLFLMGKAEDREKFLEEIRPFKALVATTTLSDEEEKTLREALAREG
jgi:uncharacterized membrane protein